MQAILLQGDPFELGRQHGRCLQDEIQSFLQQDLAGRHPLSPKPIAPDKLAATIQGYAAVIRQELPELYLELQGLAEGAGISLDEAVLLQIRRELLGTRPYTLTGDCSSVGIFNPMSPVLAQTIDLEGCLQDLGHVFVIQPKGQPKIIQYSFSGLLGYMGMNDAGLALAINLVVSPGWQVGISPYLLSRQLLACDSIEGCLAVLDRCTIASSRSFLIMDNQRLVNVEVTPAGYRILEGNFLTHTNHFLHADLQPADRLHLFSRNSSYQRKQLLDVSLQNNPDLIAIQQVFRDHSFYPTGLCAHNMGHPFLNETVAAVIMYPQQKAFWALKGKPCEGNYTLYTL